MEAGVKKGGEGREGVDTVDVKAKREEVDEEESLGGEEGGGFLRIEEEREEGWRWLVF